MTPSPLPGDIRISIVDTEADQILGVLSPGDDVPQSLLQDRLISISIDFGGNAAAKDIGSVKLTLGDQTRVENVSPYALFGDKNGNFLPGESFESGTYELAVEVYAGARATRDLLFAETIDFSIVSDTDPNTTPIVSVPMPVVPDPVDPDPMPVDPSPVTGESIGTNNEFSGVRVWVSNDISEIDDAASTASLMLGAKAIASSDQNVTGSADTMVLEGAFIDTERDGAQQWFDDVVRVTEAASSEYGIDVYAPRKDINIGDGAKALTKDMTASLDAGFLNNEQVIVVAGGPTVFAGAVVSGWLNDAVGSDQLEKAKWLLKGGFAQVTHGADNDGDDVLDLSRNPNEGFFNNSTAGSGQSTKNEFIQEFYEDLFDDAFAIVSNGMSSDAFDEIEASFVEDSLLISLENQNNNATVRGGENRIAATIGDDLARDFALEYDKSGNNGPVIDISDVGMLGILTEGGDQFSQTDMFDFLA
ncbi:hypothetical protein [uncultured Roseobacter sp.]|uniref:hypothetical protein n=1 Tax=uncultured Roseobacter sp. TaxID=114847 RepID=UPI002632D155|nr:hypothetical protein [uncultured Roseobacter sp.]